MEDKGSQKLNPLYLNKQSEGEGVGQKLLKQYTFVCKTISDHNLNFE